MLLVAMIPTGYYNWPVADGTDGDTQGPTPSDYAICYLHPPEAPDDLTFASMILSILLLGLGFLVRAVKLHKRLSVNIVGSVRHAVSVCFRRQLSAIYNKLNPESSPKRLARKLIYRPLLATFLILRVGTDAWTSMTVEVWIWLPQPCLWMREPSSFPNEWVIKRWLHEKVWWLVASFGWGVLNLVGTLGLSDGGNSDWTFGQIIPVVLLAAPLLSLFEYLYPGKHTHSS
jgi:hypothetical protein